MTDYKDIINGTLSTLVDKAKEFVASDAVSGLVDKVKSAAEESGVGRVYEQGSARARAYARITKLTLEINAARDELNRVYAEIGKLYYEQAKDAPEGYFAPLFAQADELAGGIASREAEVKGMKEDLEAEKAAPDIDADIADFEQIVDATENDGASVPGEKDGE